MNKKATFCHSNNETSIEYTDNILWWAFGLLQNTKEFFLFPITRHYIDEAVCFQENDGNSKI